MRDLLQRGSEESGTLREKFPIVAIGGSAGAQKAMIELLDNISDKTGMALVYVQHLNPEKESALVQVLQRSAHIPVTQVQEGTRLEPDHLFIIPPGTDMTISNDVFELTKRAAPPTLHSPIDRFFVSLAKQKRAGSIGIVLSGSATDGTYGLKAIKESGGMTFAQDDSAGFNSMPKSAIADGFVDAILSPAAMAQEIERLAKNSSLLLAVLGSSDEDGESDNEFFQQTADVNLDDIKKILRLVKATVGVDFINYKINTIRRRIVRRMLLHKLNNLSEYFAYIKAHVKEAHLLYQDLLINVTHFFRDEESTEYLKTEVLPQLLHGRSVHDPLRIWVPACSTGQEAYSLAIMLAEIMGEDSSYNPAQIFATDLSEAAIAKARAGIYTDSDVVQLSADRLNRFFKRVDGHYRVIKRVRDLCVFAPHNLLKDPPFSRINLISCCNLLIYFDNVLQQKVLANFHYSLNKKGYLVLGKSETIGSSTNLFSAVDKKVKIYTKKSEIAAKAVFDINFQPSEAEGPTEPKRQAINKQMATKEIRQNETLEKVVDVILLTKYVPAAVVINFDMDIIQFRGSTGLFLEPSPGKASLHLLRMVRPELELELRNAIHKVIKTGEPLKISGLDITNKGNVHHVAFEVTPLLEQTKEKLLLVVFEEAKTPSSADLKVAFSKDRRVKQLEAELISLREEMRSLIEEQDVANEELQSANEEVVSSNEELQSINEELETSKEELESSNEELQTINQELYIRNEQLSEAYEYSEQVIETIREAVVILDTGFVVKSANKAFYRTFNVSEAAEGTLIFEIGRRQWNIPRFRELLQEKLHNREHYYGFELTHSFEGVGEKVLLLSVKRIAQKIKREEIILLAIEDITEHRQAEKLLEEREAWLRNMADSVPAMLWVSATDRNFTFVNKTWLAYTGGTLQKETGIGWTEGVYKDDLEMVLTTFNKSYAEKKPFSIEYRMRRFDNQYRWILNSAVPSFNSDGTFSGYSGSCTEIHDKKLINEELEKRVNKRTHELQEVNISLERSNGDLAQFAYVASHDLQEPLRKVITFSTRLKDRFIDSVPLQGREYIEKITISAERMRKLIDDLLNFSRISQFSKKFQPTDLNDVFKDILSDFDLLIQEKGALINVQDKLPVLKAIPLQMNQLFTNLLSNALKFSAPNTKPAIFVNSRLLQPSDLEEYKQLNDNAAYYEITFRDNGIGFSQEFADQIFVIFQRLNEQQDYPGTGIGLALCRKIVRNHRGEIFARSEEGKGTVFYIILPEEQAATGEKDGDTQFAT